MKMDKYEETIRCIGFVKERYMELAQAEEKFLNGQGVNQGTLKLAGGCMIMGRCYTALCTAEIALKREQPRQPKWGSGYYICPQCGEYCKIRREERDKDPVIAVNRYCPECGQRLRE